MSHERPCGSCRVLTPVEFLYDVSDLAPMLPGPVCEACEHELIEELHDTRPCLCLVCERARARADMARSDPAAGGLSAFAIEVLGLTEEDLK